MLIFIQNEGLLDIADIIINQNRIYNIRMTPDLTFKIVFAGEGGVGKTTMLHKYIEGRFLEDTKMTIGVDYVPFNCGISVDKSVFDFSKIVLFLVQVVPFSCLI